jgi:hypothetical protein
VQTDRTVPNNKLDIIIRDNGKGACTLIDVAIPGERNVIKKEAQEILKHKYLTVEIQRMWNVKTNVIPVTIAATGTISKSFRKYLNNIQGKHEIKEPQENSHIRHSTNAKVQYSTFNTGNSVMCTMNSNYRIAATLYCL